MNPTGPGSQSSLPDARQVPLQAITVPTSALRRIVPAEDSGRVAVAAFNASL